MNMNCLLVNILNSIIDTCIHSQVFANIIIIIFLTCTSYLLLLQVLSRKNILATLPNKTINLNCYFGIIFLVILSIFYNRFAFIPTIIITCYVFLYNQIASQNSFEKNSASCRAQSIIDRLQKKIDRGDNQKSKINSGFEYFNDLLVLIEPEKYDVFGTIKQTFKHEREKYDVKQQLEVFFNNNEVIYNIKFLGTDFLCINFNKLKYENKKFHNCSFNGCHFLKSSFYKNFSFIDCGFISTSFYRTNLSSSSFENCKIECCFFNYAILINTSFYNCQFDKMFPNTTQFHNARYNIRKTNTIVKNDFVPKDISDLLLHNLFLSKRAQRVEMIPNCRFNSGDPFNYFDRGDGLYVCIDDNLDLQILKNYINTNNEEPILKRKEFKLDNDVDKETLRMRCFNHEEIKKIHPEWYL